MVMLGIMGTFQLEYHVKKNIQSQSNRNFTSQEETLALPTSNSRISLSHGQINGMIDSPTPSKSTKQKKLKQCDYCGDKFTKSRSLIDHILDRHPEKQESLARCSGCQRSFGNNAWLSQHAKYCKEKEKILFHCSYCDLVTNNYEKLKKHATMMHSVEEEKIKKFKCSHCGKKFLCVQNLSTHTKFCNARGGIRCEHCSLEFVGYRNYSHHVKTSHHDLIFCCQHCGRGFMHKNNLTCHERYCQQQQQQQQSQPQTGNIETVTESSQALPLDNEAERERIVCTVDPSHVYVEENDEDPRLDPDSDVHHVEAEKLVNDDNPSIEHLDVVQHLVSEAAEENQTLQQKIREDIEDCRNKDSNGNRIYICKEPGCFYSSNLLPNFRSHYEAKHCAQFYECPQCSKFIKTYQSLQRHVKNEHGEAKESVNKTCSDEVKNECSGVILSTKED